MAAVVPPLPSYFGRLQRSQSGSNRVTNSFNKSPKPSVVFRRLCLGLACAARLGLARISCPALSMGDPEDQCERNPLCTRGYKHRGWGGHCALGRGTGRGSPARGRGAFARGRGGSSMGPPATTHAAATDAPTCAPPPHTPHFFLSNPPLSHHRFAPLHAGTRACLAISASAMHAARAASSTVDAAATARSREWRQPRAPERRPPPPPPTTAMVQAVVALRRLCSGRRQAAPHSA